MNTKDIYILTAMFEKQAQSLQAKKPKPEQKPKVVSGGDIMKLLQKMRLMGNSTWVSPLLERSGIKDTNVSINLMVAPSGGVSFASKLMPENVIGSNALDRMLDTRFSKMIADALKKANYSVASIVSIPWLNIKRISQQQPE